MDYINSHYLNFPSFSDCESVFSYVEYHIFFFFSGLVESIYLNGESA